MKEKEAASATASGDRTATKTVKEEDEAYLKDVSSECHLKSGDYETKQKLRAGEYGAISKAIEILSSGAVSGVAEKHGVGTFLEAAPAATSFAQLRREAGRAARPRELRAASFLQ